MEYFVVLVVLALFSGIGLASFEKLKGFTVRVFNSYIYTGALFYFLVLPLVFTFILLDLMQLESIYSPALIATFSLLYYSMVRIKVSSESKTAQ